MNAKELTQAAEVIVDVQGRKKVMLDAAVWEELLTQLPEPITSPDILQRPYKTLTREEKWEYHKAVARLPIPEPRFYGIVYIGNNEVWRGYDCNVMMDEYEKLRDEHPDQEVAVAWLDSAPIQLYAIFPI